MHYWAYFHREPHSSSWSYSNEGATTYKPENGATEGWVWRDGNMAKPENVPDSTICPQSTSPSPRPAATHVTPTTAPATRAASQPTTQVHRTAKQTQRRKPPAATASPTVTPTLDAASSPPVKVAAVQSEPRDGAGPPWGLIIGAVAVVGLGSAATLRWRNRGAD
jgi:hypothetical protein